MLRTCDELISLIDESTASTCNFQMRSICVSSPMCFHLIQLKWKTVLNLVYTTLVVKSMFSLTGKSSYCKRTFTDFLWNRKIWVLQQKMTENLSPLFPAPASKFTIWSGWLTIANFIFLYQNWTVCSFWLGILTRAYTFMTAICWNLNYFWTE